MQKRDDRGSADLRTVAVCGETTQGGEGNTRKVIWNQGIQDMGEFGELTRGETRGREKGQITEKPRGERRETKDTKGRVAEGRDTRKVIWNQGIQGTGEFGEFTRGKIYGRGREQIMKEPRGEGSESEDTNA